MSPIELFSGTTSRRTSSVEIMQPWPSINAGGVIHLAGYETLGWDEATMAKRLEGIGDTLLGVYEDAERDGISTAAAADRMARARVAAAGGWTAS